MKGIIRILLSAVLLTITFAFPFYIYPFGSYNGSSTVAGNEIKYEVSMSFDGKIKTNIAGYNSGDLYYKIQDKKIYVGTTKDFKIESGVALFKIDNFFTISLNTGAVEMKLTNIWGIVLTALYALIGIWGVLALLVGIFKR